MSPTFLFWSLLVILIPVVIDATAEEEKQAESYYYTMLYYYKSKCAQECSQVLDNWHRLRVERFAGEDVSFGKMDCDRFPNECPSGESHSDPIIIIYNEQGLLHRYEGDSYDLDSLEKFIRFKILSSQSQGSVKHSQSLPEFKANMFIVNNQNFKDFFSKGEHFVNFYAPWCKYCQIFEPTWTSLAYSTDLSSVVKISKVDCTANEYTCSYFGIKEYPSILWISDGKIVDSYRGPIELDALKEFINRQINSYMIRKSAHNIQEGDEENDYLKVLIDSPLHHYQPSVLNEITKKLQRIADQLNEAKSVDSFLTSKGLSLVLYCVPWSRHCREMSNEWHQLDNLLSSQSKLNSYYIDCSTGQSEEFCDQQKVDGYPTMLLYKDGELKDEYTGKRTASSIIDYLSGKMRPDIRDEL